jgi:phytoene synthase
MPTSFVPSSVLDDAHLNRAAPPGSLRYFTLLYTPREKREIALALFLIDLEIRESARSASHDVAHTRLQWWRQEIDRLVNGNAQHPATKVLNAASFERREYARLHELIVAADMDLARMTYLNDQELRAYCTRSGGTIAELMAMLLAHPETLDDAVRKAANRLGALVRAAEIIRDARQDVYDGRLYIPLDAMDRHRATEEALRDEHTRPEGRAALQALAQSIREEIEESLASISPPMRAYLRPLYVLAGLHDALLAEIARRDFDVGPERIELGPIRKPWAAWRAARRAN